MPTGSGKGEVILHYVEKIGLTKDPDKSIKVTVYTITPEGEYVLKEPDCNEYYIDYFDTGYELKCAT